MKPMTLALAEARAAAARGEVPVGAVVVDADGTVLAHAGNRTEADSDPSAQGTAWQMLEASVVATKSLDDKKMAAWLKGAQVDTLMGKLRFDGPNNHGPDLSVVKQVINKRWVVVWPENVAGAKAELP